MQEPEQKPEQEPEQETIPKKIAALEVAKETKLSMVNGIGILLGVFFVAIFSIWHQVAGASMVAIFAIYAIYSIRKSYQKLTYFKKNYNIKL